jgi:hypothetical protein
VPPLNLMMVATQLSHFKLWYAGAVENWPLAIYELAQIRTGIDRAKSFYPNNVESNMTMMSPAVDELENAIKAKDSVNFSKAFSKLTAACNTCHEATDVEATFGKRASGWQSLFGDSGLAQAVEYELKLGQIRRVVAHFPSRGRQRINSTCPRSFRRNLPPALWSPRLKRPRLALRRTRPRRRR